MTKTEKTPKAEPAIRVLSLEEMKQAAGGGVVVHERRGVVVHD
jgi:hypothetical protein